MQNIIKLLIPVALLLGSCDKDMTGNQSGQQSQQSGGGAIYVSGELEAKAEAFGREHGYDVGYPGGWLLFRKYIIGPVPQDTTAFEDSCYNKACLITYTVYKKYDRIVVYPGQNSEDIQKFLDAWNYGVPYSPSNTGPTIIEGWTMPYGKNPFYIETIFLDTTGGGMRRELGRLKYPYDPADRRLFP